VLTASSQKTLPHCPSSPHPRRPGGGGGAAAATQGRPDRPRLEASDDEAVPASEAGAAPAEPTSPLPVRLAPPRQS
jgi:hypothetical protein